MTDIAEIFEQNQELAPLSARLERMETEDLKAQLSKAMTVTAKAVAYMAAIWAELERRGEDMSSLRVGIASYLPMVASGHLDAEALVTFAGSKTALSVVATLPTAEQRRLSTGQKIKVLTEDDEGHWTEKEMSVADIPPMTLRRVIVNGRIASPDEQRMRMLPNRVRKRRSTRITFDAEAGTVTVGGQTGRLSDMYNAAKAAGHHERSGELVPKGQLMLTEDQHKTLRMRAAETGMTQQELVRMALAMTGMI